MDKKLDTLLETFNSQVIQSNKDDNKLELRLNTIETRLDEQDKDIKDKYDSNEQKINQTQLLLTGISVGIVVLF